MNSIGMTAFTEGKGISFREGCIRNSGPEYGSQIVITVCIYIKGMKLTVHFETPEELIEFCDQHNIPYTDKWGDSDE